MKVQIFAQTLSDQTIHEAVLSLEEPLVLGRDKDSPLPLEGTAVSRKHLMLEAINGHLYVTDLSVNGTRLNGSPMGSGQTLPVGPDDIVEIPNYRIIINVLAEEPQEREEGAAGEAAAPNPPVPDGSPLPERARRILSYLSPGEALVLLLALLALLLFLQFLLSR